MSLTADLQIQLMQIATFLEEDVKNTLLQQGVKATEEVIKSIERTVSAEAGALTLKGDFVFFDKSVAASAESVPVDALATAASSNNFSAEISNTQGVNFNTPTTNLVQETLIEDVVNNRTEEINTKIDQTVTAAVKQSLESLVANAQSLINK